MYTSYWLTGNCSNKQYPIRPCIYYILQHLAVIICIYLTLYVFSSPKLNKPSKSLGAAKETAMIPCHWPQPYFDLNPYVDPKKDPPTRRLYIPPKEIPLPAFLAGRPCFVPTGPGKLVKTF